MISTELLQIIDLIDKKGSFSAAAEAFFRVPSALTYTINKYEGQLGVKIFDRTRQRARLTPAGRLLLTEGRDLLARMHDLEEQVKRVGTGWEAKLRVVVDTILPMEPLLPAIKTLQDEHPWLDIQLFEEALSGTWEALANQRADLLLGVGESMIVGSQWQKAAIAEIDMRLYCGRQHPAAALQQPVDASALDSYTHIVIADSAQYTPARDVGLLGLKRTLSVANLQHKLLALQAGAGISHLPSYIAGAPQYAQTLHEIPLAQVGRRRQMFYMVWPKSGTGKANQALREIIQRDAIFAAAMPH